MKANSCTFNMSINSKPTENTEVNVVYRAIASPFPSTCLRVVPTYYCMYSYYIITVYDSSQELGTILIIL